MGRRAAALSVLVLVGLAGCGSEADPVMPRVTDQQLDIALSDIERAGVNEEVEVVGGGLFGVLDESNWQVCEQLPEAGQPVSGAPRLTVSRSCNEDEPEPAQTSAEAVEEPSAEPPDTPTGPSPTELSAPQPITVETNEDFAALLTLTDTCGQEMADFADRYRGRNIAFDGGIVAMNPHGDQKTRYDILINAGDFSETVANPGPNFQFRDVNTVNDLHYSQESTPDSIGVGTNMRIVAEVDKFEPNSCLFLIEPISTEFR